MPNKTYDKVQLRVKFTQASNRANIGNSDTNGENIAVSFGKLSKWYEALVPTGGSSGKILAWNTAGTAKWSDPLHPSITKSADTTSTPAQLSHGGTFTAITSVTREGNGHVTKINTATYTLPADNDYRVKQENTTTSAEYRLLFSNSANDTTENAAISRKGTNLRYNPGTKSLYAGYYGSDPSITARLTSLNFTSSGAGTGRTKVRFDLATTSLTTGAPPAESGKNSSGHVTTYSWDSNIDVMTQIYIPNGDHVGSSYGPQPLMIRGDDSGTWLDWRGIATFSQSSGSITSGQVVITDGTLGLVKASGYTIATSVPSDAVFTDTKVTSTANHYTPETVSGKDKTASASGATAAWSIDVVKGVTLNTDGKGHVTGLSVTSGKIPANPVPSNNVTGSGTSGYLAKWNGANTITNGPLIGSSTTTFLRNDGSWVTPPDTKNTAGSTDTSSKIFLIGATSQAANPQTYSDDQCYVTSGTLQANKVQASVTVCANTAKSNSAGGIALYSTDPEEYGIMFRGTSNSGKHGYVQSDWATYFTMNSNAPTRGWIFRRKTDGTFASISAAGHAVFNGSVTVGGNSTNTTGCRMEYNSTTQSLDFVFV
jgi:hypothetical protein